MGQCQCCQVNYWDALLRGDTTAVAFSVEGRSSRSGKGVYRLRVPDTDLLYASQGGVEGKAADHISTHYKTVEGAPIIQDPRLHQDFGFLADTEATDKVLRGTYEYPTDMDPYTKLLLQEAHHIFSCMSEEEVINFVTTTDF
jgi:hypothetical protein